MRRQIGKTTAFLVAVSTLAAPFLTGCVSPPPTSVPVAGMEQSLVVEDPRVYQDLFQKIERARFLREGLER